jgi:hypothetical protein
MLTGRVTGLGVEMVQGGDAFGLVSWRRGRCNHRLETASLYNRRV